MKRIDVEKLNSNIVEEQYVKTKRLLEKIEKLKELIKTYKQLK